MVNMGRLRPRITQGLGTECEAEWGLDSGLLSVQCSYTFHQDAPSASQAFVQSTYSVLGTKLGTRSQTRTASRSFLPSEERQTVN